MEKFIVVNNMVALCEVPEADFIEIKSRINHSAVSIDHLQPAAIYIVA
jgi:hypothetical protein